VGLDLRVRGTADQPTVVGTMEALGVRYQGYSLERLAGNLDYRDRRIEVDLEAWENDLRVLRATGTIPAVLTLREPGASFPDEDIDLLVVADSLPAVFATGLFEQLEDVEGTVAGTFDIGGTLDNPAPSGSLTLQNAAWTLAAIGVRHESVQGTLELRRDGTMEVDATARADGLARMTGSVSLAPLSNPTFDLAVSFDDFRAVDRRDAEGNVSGIVRLTGTFDRPLIQGLGPAEGLRVESGVLYLDEFVRAATVVDLTDPRFAEFFDLSMLETRIVEESRNPFMQNLRVNVDLAVQQDTWLRNAEMNVEIAGNLRVTYDRLAADLVLTGVLDARRGSYTVFGRRFTVQEGQVEFVGIPGIDPNLDIVAQTRVRQPNTEHLDIIARVTGTLTQPRVQLASDEAAISQSDLVSYLLFGRPSYELASGEQAALRGAASSFVGVFSGTVASRLGNVLAQQWGLDYFAITELGSVGWDLGSVTQTQVEFGRYLNQDLFLVMAFQPTQVVGPNPFGTFGVRLEYTPTDRYTLETFWEDRFLRNPALGFQDAAFRSQKILGLFVFTEWGY
jgi:translocation and assembly module TamB